MIKRLKTRPRMDSFEREERKPRQHWDRFVYLGLLAAFGLGILNYIAGDKVFLRADGLVLQTRNVVEATSLIQIRDVRVAPGQSVQKGEVLLQAQSYEVIDRLSQLSLLEADLAEREAALRKESTLAKNLLPLIKARNEELAATSTTSKRAQVSGRTSSRRQTAIERLYVANVELETFTAEINGLAEELKAVVEARRRARKAVKDLSNHYNEGIYHVRSDGTVGDTVPAVGEVFNPGEPMLTVLSGKPYVLAYLPQAYLFNIVPGDSVVVIGGNIRRMGTIVRILPVSQSVPDEFRNAFRLDETRQLARIELKEGIQFPTFSAVRIFHHSPWRDWHNASLHLVTQVFD